MESQMKNGIEMSSSQLARASQDLLAAGYKVRFRAKGRSMEPTIMAGDLLTVAPVDDNDVRVGQIVMIVSDKGRAIVHRIVSCRNDGPRELIQTCGDNASVKDKPVEKQQILGKIVEVLRGGKRVDSSHFLIGVRALWYLLRASRLSNLKEKDN